MDTLKQQSLYERLGGAEGISAIVDAHMNNPVIKARYLLLKDQPEHLALIKKHTKEFFGAGSGGPEVYTGKDMLSTHRGMNISEAEYMNVIDDILMVLDKHRKDQQTKNDVLAIVYSMKDEMIRV